MLLVLSQGSFSLERIKKEKNTIRVIGIKVKYFQNMLCLWMINQWESFIPILKIRSKHSKLSKGKEDCIGCESCAESRKDCNVRQLEI